MSIPFIAQQLPNVAVKFTSVGFLSFLLGDAVGGVGGGLAAVLAGLISSVIIALITAVVQLRKQNTDGAVTIDRERDAVMNRMTAVHQLEIDVLTRQFEEGRKQLGELAAREKEFLQRQVSYQEELELTGRKRLHAMVGEVQRCVLFIHVLAALPHSRECALPAFEVRTFEDITKMYPLPESNKDT